MIVCTYGLVVTVDDRLYCNSDLGMIVDSCFNSDLHMIVGCRL